MEKPFRFQQFEVDQNGAGFKITTDALILGALAPIENSAGVLEIGTGTGVVTLMMAQRSAAHFTAVELDAISAEVAKRNFMQSPWANRIQIIHADATELKAKKEELFDFIVCNPPYFSASLLSHDDRKNSARHQQSLSPGSLVHTFKNNAKPEGKLFLISTPEYIKAIITIAVTEGLWCNKIINVYSQPGKPLLRQLVLLSYHSGPIVQEDFIIKAENVNYSNEYKKALKDYLLQSK